MGFGAAEALLKAKPMNEEALRRHLLYAGPGEKAIMRSLFDAGRSLVYLQENGFAPLAKPGGRRMEACALGRLLILAPWQHHNERQPIQRAQCRSLNAMAAALAGL